MCYIHSTLDYLFYAWVGDDISDLRLHLYTDADFAGCQTTNTSTTGVYMAIEGPNTHFTVGTISKKQGCVSYSTPEAEIVAGAFGHRQVGIPGMVLWETRTGCAACDGPSGARSAKQSPMPGSSPSGVVVSVELPRLLHFHGNNVAIM